jgi:hypothetical protein
MYDLALTFKIIAYLKQVDSATITEMSNALAREMCIERSKQFKFGPYYLLRQRIYRHVMNLERHDKVYFSQRGKGINSPFIVHLKNPGE